MNDAERDELLDAVIDASSLTYRDRIIDAQISKIVNAIIAAGYRKVPDDCVVVRREYIDDAETFLIGESPAYTEAERLALIFGAILTDQTAT